ncbi:Rossmann-like domain-containing protein [Thermophilibacter provencensis]|uniref:DUF364 domain-containing protein n=1 Tax=Thermophilibacter provencensis TaxID=1852386 RepID=A0ABT7V0Y7_9ACTN|nr:DUF364 domain-containing protein [Thermophilibacter provencensis]MDM8270131.1 DUF364 domain-containing protein [Thermophilibacter provencensis]
MTDAWSLYDQMIAQIPEDVLVRHVAMGAHHCLVEAECGTGVAALHRGGARLRMGRGWSDRPLRELAACAKSWDFEVASVGVAALNAWHNQRERLDALGLIKDAESTDPFVFLVPVAARVAAEKNDGSRPRTVVVGHFPHLAAIAEHADVAVLERTARADTDLPDTACEYLLPGADLVVMTGMTLANKTMPRLLELARDALTCVVGPSATICAPVLEAGADLVAGSVVADAALAREVVTCGAPLHGSGALEHVLVATPRGRATLAR